MFSNKLNKCLAIWYVLVSILGAQIPNIVINEFLTSNAHINYDPNYKNYSDWFELYNNEDYPVNLNGYYLTDDLTNPTRWEITDDFIIEADGYFIFWADNEDAWNHTDFQLNKDGEQVGVFTPDGSIVDTVTFNSQKTDISFGRNPNNANEWLYYSKPTPHDINNTIGHVDLITSSNPVFSVGSGFYAADISLEITADPDSEIRYTIDGSEPDENSDKYTAPINISGRIGDPNYFSEIRTNINPYSWLEPWVPPIGEVRKATIIRARAFAVDKLPSSIVTNSYFVGSEIQSDFNSISVISLVSDEKHLFSDSAGIYVPGDTYNGNAGTGNYMYEWFRPAEIQFFDENNDLKISQEVDIRIQGMSSPNNPQKGLHVIARAKYGENTIDYPLFENSKSKANKLTSFKRFMIRAWGTAWNQGMVSDALAQTSFAESSLDIQDYRPTIIFINGEYWGLQEIREANKNPYYFEEHYGIDKDDPGIDLLIGNVYQYVLDEGDDNHWQKMIKYIQDNDLSITHNYEYIKTQMDVDNYIGYIGHCMYFGKLDWPKGNQAFWRPRTSEGRWKWIQYDMDQTFYIPEYDMFNQVGRPYLFLIELLNNQLFKYKFINWFLDRINSDFKPEIMNHNYDIILNEINPHLSEHQNRWARSKSNFDHFSEITRNYILMKPGHMKSHLQSYFNLGSLNSVIINGINDGGTVKINSLLLNENTSGTSDGIYEWGGKYFEDIPIDLIAIPNSGFVFDHWEGSLDSESDSISLYLDQNMWLRAVFSPIEKVRSLYINEVLADNQSVNVDSYEDYDDWIELYNASNDTINLEGLYLTDDLTKPTKWKIPKSDSVSFFVLPNEFKIIWCDNEFEEGQEHAGFSLNKMGEQIGLTQITGSDTVFIDSVSFSEQLSNVSYCRFPDASNNWEFSLLPTPGTSNVFSPIVKVDSLYINEILVDNQNINTDSTGEYDDWIELYNASNDTINLEGLYLTDDFTIPRKWKVPKIDTTSFFILPGEYKLIWCDNEEEEGQDHAGFSINKLGEQIGLTQFTGNTVFIDSISFSNQLVNVSYGRFPDASNKWEFLLLPTPGSSNVYRPISYDLLDSPQLFQNYPNPFNLNTSIPFYLSEVNNITIDIYNIKGELVRSNKNMQQEIGYNEILWDGKDDRGNSVSSGIYFYRLQVDDFNKVKKMLFLK